MRFGALGDSMTYPLVILDFEASSLSNASFPIEVGVAVALGSDGPVHVWSSLIQPARNWIAGQDWDAAAESVHHIAASSLAQGQTTLEIAQTLNQVIGLAGHAYCDGGYYDAMWMERLFKAAGCAATFELWDMSRLFVSDPRRFRCFTALLDEKPPPHRAGDDAARLCSALVQADGAGRQVTVNPIDAATLMALFAHDSGTDAGRGN